MGLAARHRRVSVMRRHVTCASHLRAHADRNEKLEYAVVNDAEQWHQEVSHLVQAHGADPGQLLGYVFPLGEIRWAHFDTHAALTVVGLRPPDGHAHPVAADLWPPMTIPEDGGPSGPAASRYRPFLSSPEVQSRPFEGYRNRGESLFPCPEYTSLPQTELWPGPAADLTDWAAGSMRVLDEICAEYEGDPRVLGRAGTFRLKRERITQFAEAATARWVARTAIPATQAPPGARPGRTATTATRRWWIGDRQFTARAEHDAHDGGMDFEAGG
jgi:hypothetical protein